MRAIDISEDGISVNAINNRLEKLRVMGFVSRTREGKFWRYSKVCEGLKK